MNDFIFSMEMLVIYFLWPKQEENSLANNNRLQLKLMKPQTFCNIIFSMFYLQYISASKNVSRFKERPFEWSKEKLVYYCIVHPFNTMYQSKLPRLFTLQWNTVNGFLFYDYSTDLFRYALYSYSFFNLKKLIYPGYQNRFENELSHFFFFCSPSHIWDW